MNGVRNMWIHMIIPWDFWKMFFLSVRRDRDMFECYSITYLGLFQRHLRVHSVEMLVGIKRYMMSTYAWGYRLWKMLLLVLGYRFYSVEPQSIKGRSRRECTEPHPMLDERSFKTRFGKVQRFQFQIEGSVWETILNQYSK